MKKIILIACACLVMVFPVMAALPILPGMQPAGTNVPATAVPTQVPTMVPTPVPTAVPPVPTRPAIAPAYDAAGLLIPTVTAIDTQALSQTAAALPFPLTVAGKAPAGIKFDTSGTTKIKITWDSAEPMVFNVFRKLTAEKEFAVINSEPLKVTVYVDSAIRTATSYDYKIEAIDNSGNAYMSAPSQVNSAGLGLPQKPFTFKTFQNIEKVTIKWSAGSKGSFEISGYNLYRGKTPEKLELIKFIKPSTTLYDDEDVEPAIRYYYRMTAVDTAGFESEPTGIEGVIPFPKPRTGLILMPTAFRNNIHDNLGFNADFLFTYYIGSIFSDHMWEGDALSPLSVILFTGDIKGTVINEFEAWPSFTLGFTYSVLLQYDLGGSGATGASASFTQKDSVTQMYGLYLGASKKLIWDNTLHAGLMSGFGRDAQTRFMPYLAPAYLNDDPVKGGVTIGQSNFAYFIGYGRPLFWNMDLKMELIVPIEANSTPWLPNYYLINTHIENFVRFDISYMHYPGGSTLMGYINFRFSIYPNPYK